METIFSNQWTIFIVVITGAIGLGVCWLGVLFALITALGNKRWVWGISIIFLGPITGIPYALTNKEADYPKLLMVRGLILSIPALIFVIVKNVI